MTVPSESRRVQLPTSAGNKKARCGWPPGVERFPEIRKASRTTSTGSLLRLLPSGLYRRLRISTGSCNWYDQPLAGFHRRSGLGRHSPRPHPNPEGLFLVSISHIAPENAIPAPAIRSRSNAIRRQNPISTAGLCPDLHRFVRFGRKMPSLLQIEIRKPKRTNQSPPSDRRQQKGEAPAGAAPITRFTRVRSPTVRFAGPTAITCIRKRTAGQNTRPSITSPVFCSLLRAARHSLATRPNATWESPSRHRL